MESISRAIEQAAAERQWYLESKGPRIHKNYNVWVQDLANHIAERTKKLLAR